MQLTRGTQVYAGAGLSTIQSDFDFETYSEAGFIWDRNARKWRELPGASPQKKGLKTVGARVYAEHPSTEILSLKYDLKDLRGARHWKPGDPYPVELFEYIKNNGILEAWNSGFEFVMWNYHAVPRLGWPPLPLTQLRCAMAKARAHALPGKLEETGEVLNLTVKKDKDGDRLIKKFSVPQNPTKKQPLVRIRPEDDPADAENFYRYNEIDIVTEAEASSKTPDLSPDELEFWLCDQAINDRGCAIDLPTVHACIAIINQAYEKYNSELATITNGAVKSAAETAKIQTWLRVFNVVLPSLEEENVTAALKRKDIHPAAYRVLQIRDILGLASVKKVFSMANRASSAGRLHELFVYHSARTGRTAGAGVQPQNLTKKGPRVVQCLGCKKYYGEHIKDICPWCKANNMTAPAETWSWHAVESAIEIIQYKSLELLEYFFGDALYTISGCLRGLFTAGPGKELICSDYSAIEAVVLAMLANEPWRIEVFRTHGKIYEASASKISGIPFSEFERHKKENGAHHPLRNGLGKFAELASGFGGWIPAWIRFGADEFLNENQIKEAILGWRAASPAVVEFWGGQYRGWPRDNNAELYGLEGAAISAIQNPGCAFVCRDIVYQVHENILYCRLPSGRFITYHNPQLSISSRDGISLAISYEGWNTNPQMGPVGWVTMWTYGGKLCENVVQAVARDILAYAIVNLEKAGYKIVLHVHDEIAVEVLIGEGSIEEVERIMSLMPWWARNWPIKAKGGWRNFRFRKDD